MPKHYPYSPILGWSISRYGKFKLCQRQYYFEYYGKFDPEFPREKIQKLKAMTSLPLEIGNIVHDLIKDILNRYKTSQEKIDQDKFNDFLMRKTLDYVSKKEFFEIHYHQIVHLDTEYIKEQVKLNIKNFLQSERFKWLTKEATKNVKQWAIEPSGYGETRVNNLKAYCKVDFLFPLDDKIFIFDWKTGKENFQKHRIQMQGYTAWAHDCYQSDFAQIIPSIAYLNPVYKEIKITVTSADYANFYTRVKEQTEEMYTYCSDIIENIPISRQKFAMTENRKICSYCNYRELCEKKGD